MESHQDILTQEDKRQGFGSEIVSGTKIDLEKFKQRLRAVKKQLSEDELDEIPLDVRPKMHNFDFDKDTYVVISYSRKDFEEVYLFLAYLYNEGYRFWYDNGMNGTDKWLNEYKSKYENPNCLGTITFFSNSYISNSTKEELSIIYTQNGYAKCNVMISLIPFKNIDPEQLLIDAIVKRRISIPNAADIMPLLYKLIDEEKDKTFHRYSGEKYIPYLVEKLDKVFSIRNALTQEDSNHFVAANGVLRKYIGESPEVVVPKGITEIGEGAFASCSDITGVVLPEGITKIGAYAFDRCLKLVDITIPDTVKSIGECAFQSCQALTGIVIPDSVALIEEGAFQSCSALTDIVIPHGVASIGDVTFRYCEGLTSVVLSDGVASIGESAFYSCSNLTDVIIPDSVHVIGDSAFAYCISLKQLTLPKNIIEIDHEAFYGCMELESVVIPKNIRFIGRQAFGECDMLEYVIYEGTMAQWKQIECGNIGVEFIRCIDGELRW